MFMLAEEVFFRSVIQTSMKQHNVGHIYRGEYENCCAREGGGGKKGWSLISLTICFAHE
jgi:hypothetical protein